MKFDQDITRIDMERQQDNVLVKYWRGKWAEGSAAFMMDYEVGVRIESLLSVCEKAGFTVEMCDSMTGRALRGEITRIDIVKDGESWFVKKYPYGWTAKTRPLSKYALAEDAAQTAIQWLKDNGWTVIQWSDRVAAFRGEPKPIHDRGTILSLRRKVENNLTPSNADYLRGTNLAFYPV